MRGDPSGDYESRVAWALEMADREAVESAERLEAEEEAEAQERKERLASYAAFRGRCHHCSQKMYLTEGQGRVAFVCDSCNAKSPDYDERDHWDDEAVPVPEEIWEQLVKDYPNFYKNLPKIGAVLCAKVSQVNKPTATATPAPASLPTPAPPGRRSVTLKIWELNPFTSMNVDAVNAIATALLGGMQQIKSLRKGVLESSLPDSCKSSILTSLLDAKDRQYEAAFNLQTGQDRT